MTWPPAVPDPHSEEITGFLAAIAEDPDEAAARLVFADWLDERGDPRGEMLRLAWEVSTLSPAEPRRKVLDARLAAWWQAHRVAWLGDQEEGGVEVLFERGRLWVILTGGCHPLLSRPALLQCFRQGWVTTFWFHQSVPSELTRAAELGLFDRLLSVRLVWAQVPEDVFTRLGANRNLRQLDLSGASPVTDATLAHFASLNRLQHLELRGSLVTDAGLAHLRGLTGLRWLDVRVGGSVSAAGVAALQKDLPRCRIDR
jgi:uncharacterized protein (TIGR02996 family)